jgi:pantetheine-phosphate adenylyltransferase
MTDMPKIAIYPGSFDPVTNGHLDIIERGLKLFDKIIIAILNIIERGLKLFDKIIIAILTNPGKQFLFTLEERMQMLEVCLKKFSNVEIGTFDGLTVDYAAQCNAQGILRGLRALSDFEYEFQMALMNILRGLRALSDFEYEFQMALMNRRLNREIQTVFLMTGMRWIYTSSSIIKEAAQFGGNIKGMVPPVVEKRIKEKYARKP